MNLDLSRIQPGMVVKNYSELCSLLGIKPNSNIPQQLNSISKYINVSKIDGTRKYIINEIYKQKDYQYKPKREGKYIEPIQNILLMQLVSAPKHQVIYSHRQLMVEAGFINETFYESDVNIAYVLQSHESLDGSIRDANIEVEHVSAFKDEVEINMSSRLNSVLNSMVKRNLIVVRDWYMIQADTLYTHLATEDEYQIIKSIEMYLFNKYKYSHWGDVLIHRNDKFKKEWNESIGIHKWARVYRVKIITLNESILDDIDVKSDITVCRQEVNQIFISLIKDKINNNEKERYKEISNILISCLVEIDTKPSKTIKGAIRGITKNKAK